MEDEVLLYFFGDLSIAVGDCSFMEEKWLALW